MRWTRRSTRATPLLTRSGYKFTALLSFRFRRVVCRLLVVKPRLFGVQDVEFIRFMVQALVISLRSMAPRGPGAVFSFACFDSFRIIIPLLCVAPILAALLLRPFGSLVRVVAMFSGRIDLLLVLIGHASAAWISGGCTNGSSQSVTAA